MVSEREISRLDLKTSLTRWPFGWLLGALVVFIVLLLLGVWQLQRAHDKQDRIDRFQARLNAPAVQVSREPMAKDLEYFPARARGQFESQNQILLDNQVRDGRVGYYVLTPFRILHSDTRILVNRGWIALGHSRASLPEVNVPVGERRISGRLYRPPADYFTLEKEPASLQNTLWQNLDLAQFRAQAGYDLQPYVLRLDPELAGGYVRDWPVHLDSWADRHRGYAVQWFGLALVLGVGCIFLFRTRRAA